MSGSRMFDPYLQRSSRCCFADNHRIRPAQIDSPWLPPSPVPWKIADSLFRGTAGCFAKRHVTCSPFCASVATCNAMFYEVSSHSLSDCSLGFGGLSTSTVHELAGFWEPGKPGCREPGCKRTCLGTNHALGSPATGERGPTEPVFEAL